MHTDFPIASIIENLSSENDSSISSSASSSSSSNPQNEISALCKTLNNFQCSDLPTLANEIYENLIEHLAMEIFFDFYRSHQLDSIKLKSINDAGEESESKSYDNPRHDIFGHSLNGIKKLECICPKCSRSLTAFRLAPHLEKCLGMGRNSSRLASKRIALVIKNSNGTNSE